MNESSAVIDFNLETKRLTVRNCNNFPDQLWDYTDQAEILDMSFGAMTTLPKDISRFNKVKTAFFSNHQFESIPESLSEWKSLNMVGFKSCKITGFSASSLPKHLKGLILTDNQIQELPSNIGELSELRKLMLAGNYLEALPEDLLRCANLELLRLPVNQLSVFPEWILELQKLGWFNDSSNQYSRPFNKEMLDQKIDWSQIKTGEILGENLRNTVYRSEVTGYGEMAVKIYGHGLTTDGLSDDEMNLCLIAGTHPNLIGAVAKTYDPQSKRSGLIMPFIDSSYSRLGSPPSLDSLTRDVFNSVQIYSSETIRRIIRGIVAATKHLHNNGIMHGDIYAHNVLINAAGNSILGDFGAATYYDLESDHNQRRQRVDVRGIGYLIDDLISLGNGDYGDLKKLRQACLNPKIDEVPLLEDLEKALNNN